MGSVILLEGRKDNLEKKYSNLGEEILKDVLENEFIVSTNFKYADWLLSLLEKGDDEEFILGHISNLKKFDKIGKNLEKKDINQYLTLSDLAQVVSQYVTKSEEEEQVEQGTLKIYEDPRILVVRILTHKASCKYGKGTKWCTTQESPGYFEKYTSGGKALYYIIVKDFDINNKFYKMALNKSQNGQEDWYDATDTIMPPREVELLKVAIGKTALKNIDEDFKIQNKSRKEELISALFKKNSFIDKKIENFLGTGKKLVYDLFSPNYLDENHSDIGIEVSYDDEPLEKGAFGLMFDLNDIKEQDNFLRVQVVNLGLEPDELVKFQEWNSMYTLDLKLFLPIPESVGFDPEHAFQKFYKTLLDYVVAATIKDENLVKYILGDEYGTWYAPRGGYKFLKNEGMVKKMVDYLDAGKKGTAMDFLIDSNIITPKVENGETIYLNKKGEEITPRGYFSTFFAALIRSEIASYEKVGKKYFISKGPNFEAFKKGKLYNINQ